MHETLNRSFLGSLRAGSPVNLERVVPANGRFGGHTVSGHIDGTGTISIIIKDGNITWYTMKTGPPILRYIIEEGSVAIDDVDLTVTEIYNDGFSVSIMPHITTQIILPEKRIGDTSNLESDHIVEYVERLLGSQLPKTAITAEFLVKHGS